MTTRTNITSRHRPSVRGNSRGLPIPHKELAALELPPDFEPLLLALLPPPGRVGWQCKTNASGQILGWEAAAAAKVQ